MRDPERIDRILAKVERLWKLYPDWRLGQLISNMKGLGPQDVFYWEDDLLEDRLDECQLGYVDAKSQPKPKEDWSLDEIFG